MDDQAQGRRPAKKKSSGDNSTTVLVAAIGGGVALLLLLGVVVYLMVSGGNDKQNTAGAKDSDAYARRVHDGTGGNDKQNTASANTSSSGTPQQSPPPGDSAATPPGGEPTSSGPGAGAAIPPGIPPGGGPPSFPGGGRPPSNGGFVPPIGTGGSGPGAGAATPPGIPPGGGPPSFPGGGRPPSNGGFVPPGNGGSSLPPGYPGATAPGGPDNGSGAVVGPPDGDVPRFPPGGGSSVGPPGGVVPPPGVGGSPIGPPMGGGGGFVPPNVGGTGGGFNPNQPAPALNSDGKRKAQLENVYAAAFDKTKGEFLVFNQRWDQRTKRLQGSLIRYNVAGNFVAQSRYKLPHLPARAVVDDKNGLLYVVAARADSQLALAQLAQQVADHAAAMGDIALYDLKPLYEGKVEDSSELKPVATLPFYATNRFIRGLLLSEDGKRLYVLTTQINSGRPTKSTLSIVDTASRKTVKTRELPEPAGEMIFSADGKQLILTELSASSGGAVRIVSADDLQNLRSYPVPGTPLDLAVTPKGHIFVSVVTSTSTGNGGPGPRPGGGPGRPGAGGGGIGAPPSGAGGIGPPPVGGGGDISAPPGGVGGGGGIGPPPGGVGGGGGIGPPPGGVGGGGGGIGGGTASQFQAKIVVLSDKEGMVELKLPLSGRAANNGYIKVSPDGRLLFVGSYREPGFDIYDIADPDLPTEMKHRAGLRTAGGTPVGGHFFLSPDGKYIVFHSGAVIDPEDSGGQSGVPIGLPGGGGNSGFPGGLPGGGGNSGFPGGLPAPGGAGGDTPPGIPPNPGGGFPGGLPAPGGAGGTAPPSPPLPPPPPGGATGGSYIPLPPGGPRPGGVPAPPGRPGGAANPGSAPGVPPPPAR